MIVHSRRFNATARQFDYPIAPIVFAVSVKCSRAHPMEPESTGVSRGPSRARAEITLPCCGLLLMEIQFLLIQFQFDCRSIRIAETEHHYVDSQKYLLAQLYSSSHKYIHFNKYFDRTDPSAIVPVCMIRSLGIFAILLAIIFLNREKLSK